MVDKNGERRQTSDSVLDCAADSSNHYFVLEGSEDYEAELDCNRSQRS